MKVLCIYWKARDRFEGMTTGRCERIKYFVPEVGMKIHIPHAKNNDEEATVLAWDGNAADVLYCGRTHHLDTSNILSFDSEHCWMACGDDKEYSIEGMIAVVEKPDDKPLNEVIQVGQDNEWNFG